MTDSGVRRRLAAIVASDAVGYSRLMARDEAGALAALKTHREAITRHAAGHGGRLVGSAGDSVLLEFASVVDAVEAMIAAQREIAGLNADLPEDRRMLFRMGVNLGDVLLDGDDIFGDGVNVAARLEPLSRPGGICITAEVARLLPAALRAEFDDQGERRVKNIPRPLHIWQWKGALELAPPPGGGAADRPPGERAPTRVLVLPFESRGAGDEQAWFAADLADDIVAGLSHMTALVAVDDRAAAHDFTISGSVRWAGERVRVTAHLTDELAGTRVWSERYDRTGGDIFALEDDIAEDVVVNARMVIKQQEGLRLASRDIASLSVPELLSAAAGIFTSGAGRHDEARRMLERAVALEPGNSMAQAMLVSEGLRELMLRAVAPGEAECRALEQRAREAVRLDPNSFYARMTLGLLELYLYHRHAAARQELERALELNPHLGMAQSSLGLIRALTGDAGGLEAMRHAIGVDRHNAQNERFYYELATALFAADELDAAAEAARQSVSRAPDKPHNQLLLAAVLAARAEQPEAAALIARLAERRPGLTAGNAVVPPFLDRTDEARYRDGLRRAGLPG